jgi:hypothetical protein
MTYGLSDHYRSIFQITRLDDAIAIHDSEEEAVRAANSASHHTLKYRAQDILKARKS